MQQPHQRSTDPPNASCQCRVRGSQRHNSLRRSLAIPARIAARWCRGADEPLCHPASFGDRLGAGLMGFLNSDAPIPGDWQPDRWAGHRPTHRIRRHRATRGRAGAARRRPRPRRPARCRLHGLDSGRLPGDGNLIGGVTTGQRTDPSGIAQRRQEQGQRAAADYVARADDIDPQLKAAMLADPATCRAYLGARALYGRSSPQPGRYGVQGSAPTVQKLNAGVPGQQQGIAREEHQGVDGIARADGRQRPAALRRATPSTPCWVRLGRRQEHVEGFEGDTDSATKTRVNALCRAARSSASRARRSSATANGRRCRTACASADEIAWRHSSTCQTERQGSRARYRSRKSCAAGHRPGTAGRFGVASG